VAGPAPASDAKGSGVSGGKGVFAVMGAADGSDSSGARFCVSSAVSLAGRDRPDDDLDAPAIKHLLIGTCLDTSIHRIGQTV